MTCKKCGKEIPSDSLFCNYCGESQRHEVKPRLYVELHDGSYFSITSFDENIMNKLFTELVANNPKQKKGLKLFFFNGKYWIRDKGIYSDDCIKNFGGAICEKFLLSEGFSYSIIPGGGKLYEKSGY